MLKIKITVGGNGFELEGEIPTTEALAFLKRWFDAIWPDVTQAQIDELTARVAAANDTLKQAVDRNTPAS